MLARKRGQFVIEALRLDIWVMLANGAMPFRLTTNDLAQETAPSVGGGALTNTRLNFLSEDTLLSSSGQNLINTYTRR